MSKNVICFSHLGNAFFSFTLKAFNNKNFTGEVPNPVRLDKTLYFKATVETKSDAPNLDLFPVLCWSSQSDDPDSDEGKITLIKGGYVFTQSFHTRRNQSMVN